MASKTKAELQAEIALLQANTTDTEPKSKSNFTSFAITIAVPVAIEVDGVEQIVNINLPSAFVNFPRYSTELLLTKLAKSHEKINDPVIKAMTSESNIDNLVAKIEKAFVANNVNSSFDMLNFIFGKKYIAKNKNKFRQTKNGFSKMFTKESTATIIV